jgi:hypothetical protein
MNNGQTPPLPADVNAERALLGSCLTDSYAFASIEGLINERMFFLEKHAWVFQAMQECFDSRRVPDLVTVADALKRQDRLEPLGGLAFLGELTAENYTSVYIQHYAAIVRRTYTFRRIIQTGGQIAALGYNEREELDNVLSQIDQHIDALETGKSISAIPADQLYALNIPPIRVIIPNLLVQGFGFLAAHPGMGKTWLLLQWAIAKASGGMIFGDIPVAKSKVLFLALEDTHASLQERLRKLCTSPPPENLLFITKESEWKAIDEGGLKDIELFLRQHTDIDLVLIDTLTAISPTIPRGNPYREEYKAFRPLADLADRYRIAILGAYHFNQGGRRDILEMVNGSAGLPSVAVNRLGIIRERGQAQGQLISVAKRGTSDIDWMIEFDSGTCQWVKIGDTGAVRMSEQRKNVHEFLEQEGEATIKEIMGSTEYSYNSLVQLLKRMRDEGTIISPKRGVYALHDSHDSSVRTRVMSTESNGTGNNGVHDSHDSDSGKNRGANWSHESHESHELHLTASQSGTIHDNKEPPPVMRVMNRTRVEIKQPDVDPTVPAVEGYTHWNMGGVWYAATAQSPQTTVSRGVETEQQAIAECRKHKAEMKRKYSGGN